LKNLSESVCQPLLEEGVLLIAALRRLSRRRVAAKKRSKKGGQKATGGEEEFIRLQSVFAELEGRGRGWDLQSGGGDDRGGAVTSDVRNVNSTFQKMAREETFPLTILRTKHFITLLI
jgi:hypothetical protein